MPSEPSSTSLLGSFVVTVCVSFMLYGIMVAQSYFYMLNGAKRDSWWLKGMVLAVWILEVFHTALVIHMVYEYLVRDFTDLADVGFIVWSVGLFVMVEMVIVGLVQGFYLRRIFLLSGRSYLITGVTGFLLLLRIALGFATAALTYPLGQWVKFRQATGPLVTLSMGLGLAALVDALIAGILIFQLHRSKTGFSSTDGVIRSLMAYLVNTGAITGVVSLAIVLSFVCLEENLLFAGLATVTAKLYSNSLLGTLNTREALRSKTGRVVEIPTMLSDLSNSQPQRAITGPTTEVSGLSGATEIQVFKETHKFSDFASEDERRSTSEAKAAL
ncbi:hypothetical protein K474DRAFT_1711633 [Panus rudis PR-1116 ss-1]|nr:hypothetical protein K474DRAFT_1711633 [Panus rudis PR-1116 ss-1]